MVEPTSSESKARSLHDLPANVLLRVFGCRPPLELQDLLCLPSVCRRFASVLREQAAEHRLFDTLSIGPAQGFNAIWNASAGRTDLARVSAWFMHHGASVGSLELDDGFGRCPHGGISSQSGGVEALPNYEAWALCTLPFTPRLRSFSLYGQHKSGSLFTLLARCAALEGVALRLRSDGGPMCVSGVRALRALPHLKRLCLDLTDGHDDDGMGPKHVGQVSALTQLTSLKVWGADPSLLPAIRPLASLRSLQLYDTWYFDGDDDEADNQGLLLGSRHLTRLVVQMNCEGSMLPVHPSLPGCCSALHHLELQQVSFVEVPSAEAALRGLDAPHMTSLVLDACKLPMGMIWDTMSRCSRLRVISMSFCWDDMAREVLAVPEVVTALTSLRALHLYDDEPMCLEVPTSITLLTTLEVLYTNMDKIAIVAGPGDGGGSSAAAAAGRRLEVEAIKDGEASAAPHVASTDAAGFGAAVAVDADADDDDAAAAAADDDDAYDGATAAPPTAGAAGGHGSNAVAGGGGGTAVGGSGGGDNIASSSAAGGVATATAAAAAAGGGISRWRFAKSCMTFDTSSDLLKLMPLFHEVLAFLGPRLVLSCCREVTGTDLVKQFTNCDNGTDLN